MSFRFAECVVDPSCFELRRRDRPVKLEPKVFDVLLHLIDQRDRVVTKQELLDALWPGEAVSDSVLPRCIAALRRALGDTRARQSVIATVHGRGYRFVAKLETLGAADPSDAQPPVQAAAPAPLATAESDFVGRVGALQRLTQLLQEARAGRGGLALIVGEPGIGKTRLADELGRHAIRTGCELLVGRCHEGDGAPAYWPWVQVLRDAAEATPDDAILCKQLGTGAPELAELVPELRARLSGLGDLGAPAGPSGNQARFRLYDAVSRFLTARSRARPLLLVVDDLHWADASSLGLLRFLARPAGSAPILIVATYRDVDVRRGHPLADVLGALAREARCERVALSGLAESEIEAFVARLAGEAPREELVARLHEMTEGNPFFLREMVRLIADLGDISAARADVLHALALPQGVRDAIGRRLDSLSQDCNASLRAAAVLGRSFRISLLAEMLEAPEDNRSEALLELLAEALDAGLIVEAAHGTYSFAHALTRQTLYEELRAPQRIALHRHAGLALERSLDPTSRAEHHAELAHHFFEAAPGGDVDKAIEYARAAAETCHRSHAYDEAVSYWQRALEALELSVPVDERQRAELTLALGQAQFTAGIREHAMPTLRKAADLARRLDRFDLMARAAITIRGFGEMGTRPDEGVIELIRESLEALPDDAHSLRASLLSRLNGAAAMSMNERYSLAQRALDMAQLSGDPVALRDAYGAMWWATLGPDRVAEREQLARELRALAQRANDPRALLQALESELGVNLLRGNFAGTQRALEEFENTAEELRQPVFIFMGMNYRTSWLIDRGQYAAAAERVEQSRRYGLGVVPFAEAVCTGQLYWARSAQGLPPGTLGDPKQLEHLLQATFTQQPVSRIFMAALQQSIDADSARALELLDGIDLRLLERDEHWLMAMTPLSWLLVDVGDRDRMEWLFHALRPYSEFVALHDLLRASHNSVASSLGTLAGALGDLDTSVEFYEQAIEREAAADMRPAHASSRLGLALSLLRRRGRGDRRRGLQLAREAELDCDALGLGSLSRSFAFRRWLAEELNH